MKVIEALLTDLPDGWKVIEAHVGANWILSLVSSPHGAQQAGVASAPQQIAADSRFQPGRHVLNEEAQATARLLLSADESEAAVGLATLNALNQPDETALTTADAADWLSAQCAGQRIAIFGRFPFIDGEIRPYARQVWVFEQEPQAGELGLSDVAAILPQTDIAALTSSSIINHTIDTILPHVRPGSRVALLGPSTPLSNRLFACGIEALFGVRVTDVQQVIDLVAAGAGFQKMQGLQRVSLFKTHQPSTNT